ncbi:tetratricopeptide repeat protein [Streptomyces sp. 7-21]|uniref:ATP-binding protein n=1 Tax=Streptomyces sp. 7-21 TaxID=2802283 RepID=UPI0019202803|nr:tetratricopeptide repeat protein [Streptomyces sp. 7-21]MBL1068037.1 tetratricopeptide repeat protein [Streptomyces sp. 7-21]
MGSASTFQWYEPRDAAEFVALMRALKEASGLSLRELERRAEKSGEVLARSTLAETLSRETLPPPHTLTAFVRACGDEAHLPAWLRARDRIIAAAARTSRVPRQLPLAPMAFIGRDPMLSVLDKELGAGRASHTPSVPICVVTGQGGIGKTWLALRWAHDNADLFPDGQLYLDLRGFAPFGEPASPETAVRGFLDALGAERVDPLAGLDGQAARFRELTRNRRLLLVLDNARDTEQVLPLLPAGHRCAVLITSRSRLSGLAAAYGARQLTLEPMTPQESRDVLADRLGADAVAAEPRAVDVIVERCAGLPLALAVSAARASEPGFSLADLARELREPAHALDALDLTDLTVNLRTAFGASCRALDPRQLGVFRLLSLYPGADIALPAAASLTALPAPRLRVLLRALEDGHLVRQHSPGRYAVHDLLRGYARDLLAADAPDEREPALRRLFDYYLHTAHAAACLLSPYEDWPVPPEAAPGAQPEAPAGPEEALRWLTAERATLLAVVTQAAHEGFDTHAWQLALVLTEFLQRQGLWHAWAGAQRLALESARRQGQHRWLAHLHRALGSAEARLKRFAEAEAHFEQARTLFTRVDDGVGLAHIHRASGWLCEQREEHAEALAHHQRALAIYRDHGQVARQAIVLNDIGWLHALLGNHRQAVADCEEALVLHRSTGNLRGEADTMDSLGYAHHHLGDHDRAAECYLRALALYRDAGDRPGQAATMARLGDTHQAAGRAGDAREVWQRALTLFEELGHPDAASVRDRLRRLERGGSG